MARRDAIYAALKEAEFDRQLGNLGNEEYRDVRARYTHRPLMSCANSTT